MDVALSKFVKTPLVAGIATFLLALELIISTIFRSTAQRKKKVSTA